MSDKPKHNSILIEHQGNGWLQFTCPANCSSTTTLTFVNRTPVSTTKHKNYQLLNQCKIQLAKLLTWNSNEKAVIDILMQTIKTDGTISFNANLPSTQAHDAMLGFWSTVQLDGDITFAINQQVLSLDEYQQYAASFFQVQNQFLDTVQSALRAIGLKFKILLTTVTTALLASSIYSYFT